MLSSYCDGLECLNLVCLNVDSATIGFGDVAGMNPDERLFSIFAMITGGGIFAYGITNVRAWEVDMGKTPSRLSNG